MKHLNKIRLTKIVFGTFKTKDQETEEVIYDMEGKYQGPQNPVMLSMKSCQTTNNTTKNSIE